MKRQISFCILAALLFALLVPAAWGQAMIRGVVKDHQGNPVPGATVQMVNKDNGRKYNLKTDKRGEFNALGVETGFYNVTVVSKDGQTLFTYTGKQFKFGENIFVIDLQKEQQQAATTMSPEEKKQIEQQQQEAVKIKGLNESLAAAKAAEEAGNPQQAVQILTQATQVDATQPVIWVRLADAERAVAKQQTDPAVRKETYNRAVEDYKKAIALKPQGGFYNNMGDALAKMGDFDGAIVAYQQAAAIDPPNAAMYYFNEGAVLTNSGKVDLANAAFDKSIAADPTKAESYYQKGVNLLGKATVDKNGKMVAPPEAEEALKKYLELAPTGPNADAAKQLLATLGTSIETSFGKSKTTKKK